MSNQTINYIQHLILSLKSGQSMLYAQKTFPDDALKTLLGTPPHKLTNIEFELKLLIDKGILGFPVLKLLENLHNKASSQLIFEMDKHAKKAPFLALIPLFLFQVPSLILVFLYPMVANFIQELK